MNEPQVTHSFQTKEEENRFYVECGKAERTKEVIEMIEAELNSMGMTPLLYDRAISYSSKKSTLIKLKAKIEKLSAEVS